MKKNLIYLSLIPLSFVLSAYFLKSSGSVNTGPGNALITVRAGSIQSNSDVQQLKHLAAGVGWEFSPNAQIAAELKRVGIKSIRCINIEPLSGQFNTDGTFSITNPGRILSQFETCRAVGATPHICIATSLPPALRLQQDESIQSNQTGLMGNQTKKYIFGPTDWGKFRNYYKAFFKYVVVDQGFNKARFEVGNEPDISGIFVPNPPEPARASEEAYLAYLNVYRNIAQAAKEFENENPGLKIQLGGPALAWAYTFNHGKFNWSVRFIQDVAKLNLKCDFIGLHYYGNISSLSKDSQIHNYPSYDEMLQVVKTALAKNLPGKHVPIWMTEWGPSYHTDGSDPAQVNGNHLGAAWSAAFLATMLQERIAGAMFLVTTDLQQKGPDGKLKDITGWPALFVNPASFGGKAYPKPIFHVFDMISHLQGSRVIAEGSNNSPGVFSCVDAKTGKIQVMIWNYQQFIPENGVAVDNSSEVPVNLLIKELPQWLGNKPITIHRWEVSENEGNLKSLADKGISLSTANTSLPTVDQAGANIKNNTLSYQFRLPRAAVTLIEFSNNGG